MAGRLILLKAALDSTPIYWLNLYRLPATILNRIERLRRQFLWGESTNSQRKLHLIGWDRICQDKTDGGLGVSLIKNRNHILLAKWWWRAYSERDSFWNKLFVSCYDPKWNYDIGGLNPRDCSPVVRSIITIKNEARCDLVSAKSNFKWSCGNGYRIFFYEDVWLLDTSLVSRFPSLYSKSAMTHCTVSEMLNILRSPQSRSIWVSQLLSEDQDNLSSLISLTEEVILTDKDDKPCWIPSGGAYTSTIANKILFNQPHGGTRDSSLWNTIWKLKTPPKVSIFFWKLVWEVLPTRLFLSQRLRTCDPTCAWCGQTNKSLVHLFWDCELALWAWHYIESWWSIKHDLLFKSGFSLQYILRLYKPKFVQQIWQIVVTATLWSVWLARNDLIFNNVKISKLGLQDLIFFRIEKWGLASKTILFAQFPLWKVNPLGLIHVHHYLDVSNYCKIRRDNFNIICMVDAAWRNNAWDDL